MSTVVARAEKKVETRAAPARDAADAKPGNAKAAGPENSAYPVAAQPTVSAPSEAAAEAAYQQAQLRYAQHDTKGALESMRESYRLCQRPELLYNLAALEQELHQCSPALADYTSYLQLVPQGRYRQGAEQARAELSRECPAPPAPSATVASQAAPAAVISVLPTSPTETKEPPPAHAEAPLAPIPSYWTPPRVIGWSAISAGVLAGAGALYFVGAAFAERHEVQRSNDAAAAGKEAFDWNAVDRQHRYDTTARVLAISGGALVTGGVLVLLFGSKDAAPPRATAQVQALPGWLGASYCQRF